MRGMVRALPDVGAVFVERAQVQGKKLIWAPLFAVNDRESTILSVDALRPYHQPQATRIGILNNRVDRAVRALKFAEIAAKDLKLDYYITFGAYEAQVTHRMIELGFPAERIINLGASRKPTEAEILDEVATLIHGEQGLLIGMVNIHTEQAELLMHFFERHRMGKMPANALLAENNHISTTAQRQRLMLSRLQHTT